MRTAAVPEGGYSRRQGGTAGVKGVQHSRRQAGRQEGAAGSRQQAGARRAHGEGEGNA